MTSRRSILTGALALGPAAAMKSAPPGPSPFLNLLRTPDYTAAYDSDGALPLSRSGLSLETKLITAGLQITLSAPRSKPTRIHVRWHAPVTGNPLVLGDAWERSYGELAWRSLVPERVMPWYFLTYDSQRLHGYGVQTQAAALCFWQLDSQGVSLWLDVSNGGSGVELGDRALHAATIVTRQGVPGESPAQAATAFCRQLCPQPRLASEPVYGTNDWYYAYGKNSADQTLRDTDLVAELSLSNKARPFAVIDMGWKDGSATFPSMPKLAADIKSRQVRPGLWIRPLEAEKNTPPNLLLSDKRFCRPPRRCRRQNPADRLQHGRPPRSRTLRSAAHRRRYQRPRMGAHPPHGSQHTRLPLSAARYFLRRRSRLRRHHSQNPLGTQPSVARPDRPLRRSTLHLA